MFPLGRQGLEAPRFSCRLADLPRDEALLVSFVSRK